jgi:hypothetical protein
MIWEPVHFLPDRVLIDGIGRRFVPHVCGRPREDGTWEAWIEFRSVDGAVVRVTDRETTQPNRAAVEYWAGGLEPVYFEGAFTRASERRLPSEGPSSKTA